MNKNTNSAKKSEKEVLKDENILPETEQETIFTESEDPQITPVQKSDKILKTSLFVVAVIVLAVAIWGVGALIVNNTHAAAIPISTPTFIIETPLEATPAFTTDNAEDGVVRLPEVIITPAPTETVVEDRTDFLTYTVVEGDTIFGIAEMFGLEPETILWANWFTLGEMPDAIYPGTEVLIPPVDGAMHMWYEGDGLNGVALYFGVTAADIVNYPFNNLDPTTLGDWGHPNIAVGTLIYVPGGRRQAVASWVPARGEEISGNSYLGPGACGGILYGYSGTGSFTWPTTAHYLSGYDYTPPVHNGLDFDGTFGSPIYAADSGVIIYSGWSDRGYGNLIVIDHDNGWQTYYGHLLDDTLLPCGSNVLIGELIASMGSTGNSTGPHLHFELRSYGSPVNPWDYLN